MQTIPPTCPDFIEHPHLVNGRGCYTCQCAAASESQGTSELARALQDLGIACTVEQTGGFTMCVFISLKLDHYIYANSYGASIYDADGHEKDLFVFNEPQDPASLAGKIAKYLDPEK